MKARIVFVLALLSSVLTCHGYTLSIISSTPTELQFSASYPVYGDLFGFNSHYAINGGVLSAYFQEMGTTLGGYLDIQIDSPTLASHGWIVVDPTGGDGTYSTFAGYLHKGGVIPSITESHVIYPDSSSVHTWTFRYVTSSDQASVPDGGSSLWLASLAALSLGFVRQRLAAGRP